MAGVAKVCGAEAEKHRHRATVATFVFEKIGAMLGTHLGTRHIRTTAADQFLRIEFLADFGVTTRFAAIIGLLALIAHIIGVAIHSQVGHILGVGILDDTLVFQTTK